MDPTEEQDADRLLKKKAPAANRGSFVDMSKLVGGQQSLPSTNPPATGTSPTGQGVDPTAAAILKGFSPRRTASDVAQDQSDADRIRASAFGNRVGGFAQTRSDYRDDPSKSMAERMSDFNNRTTREGQQELGPDQVKARSSVGLSSNVGTPPLPFDLNRLTVTPGGPVHSGPDATGTWKDSADGYARKPIPGITSQPHIGYDTTGQPSGMAYPPAERMPSETVPNTGRMPNSAFAGHSQYGDVSMHSVNPSKLLQPPGGFPEGQGPIAEPATQPATVPQPQGGPTPPPVAAQQNPMELYKLLSQIFGGQSLPINPMQ